jgi:meso-butanediol dehydrogenase/(S,S)-butanediol dehydrogenase/diacetyl reductase
MLGVNVTGSVPDAAGRGAQMLTQASHADGRPRGKIIMMASIAGPPRRWAHRRGDPALPRQQGRRDQPDASAAFAFAPQITVNAICPGLVETDMWQRMDRDWSALQGCPRARSGSSASPACRWAGRSRPTTSPDLAGFLASPQSDYMTGQSINIDGGSDDELRNGCLLPCN